MIKISVIIPVYNAEKFIKRCLESIIQQNYNELEIVVVDDGSTDNSRNIINELAKNDDRIKYCYQENRGVSYARNYGIAKATGEYLTFVDADDYMANGVLNNFKKICIKSRCDIYRYNYYYSSEQNIKQSEGKNYEFSNRILSSGTEEFKQILLDIISGKVMTFIWVLFIKRSLLYNNLFNPQISYMEDKVFYLQIFSKARTIMFLNDKIYFYFYDETFTKKTTQFYEKYIDNICLVNSELKKIINTRDSMEHIGDWFVSTLFNTLYLIYNNKKNHFEYVNNKKKIKKILNNGLVDISICSKKIRLKYFLICYSNIFIVLYFFLQRRRING